MSEATQGIVKKFLGQSAVYSLSVGLSRAGHFLLVPILWYKLTLADFGIIGLCQSLSVFLTPLFDLGLSFAIQRLYYEWPEKLRDKYLSAIFFLILSVNG